MLVNVLTSSGARYWTVPRCVARVTRPESTPAGARMTPVSADQSVVRLGLVAATRRAPGVVRGARPPHAEAEVERAEAAAEPPVAAGCWSVTIAMAPAGAEGVNRLL